MAKVVTQIDPTDPFDEGISGVSPHLVGSEAWFQLLFVGAPVEALMASRVAVGAASFIYQTEDPLPFRYVDVLTLPTHPLLIREAHHNLLTRPGAVTTVVEVEIGLVPDRGLRRFFEKGEHKAEATLAAAVALLDERIADRRITGQVWIKTAQGPVLMDVTRAVRYFEPALEAEQPPEPILSQITEIDLGADQQIAAALQCYLAGLEMRVSPAGFVLLAGALDTLCPGKKNTFNVNDLEADLESLGVTKERQDLVRIVKVRGNRVHKGFRPHSELQEAWYDVEELVRSVLRKKLGLRDGWPSRVPMSEGVPYSFDRVDDADQTARPIFPSSPTIGELIQKHAIRIS